MSAYTYYHINNYFYYASYQAQRLKGISGVLIEAGFYYKETDSTRRKKGYIFLEPNKVDSFTKFDDEFSLEFKNFIDDNLE